MKSYRLNVDPRILGLLGPSLCCALGYPKRTRADNKDYFGTLVSIRKS